MPSPLSAVTYHLLLALVSRDRHGYGIKRAVEEQGGPILGPGTLYAAIQRLEDEGLITESPWRPDPDLDDQRRRYYRLTTAGRRTLTEETERMATVVRRARRTLGLADR